MSDETIESNTISIDSLWQMFLDGAPRMGQRGKIVAGAGVVFISPKNDVLPLRKLVDRITLE